MARGGLDRGAGAGQPLLPPPRRQAEPQLRPGLGPGLLRRARTPLDRSDRLLQTAARDVLRGDPLRAPAQGDGASAPGPPLVSGLPPRRAAAGPFEPEQDPDAAGPADLSPLLRARRRVVSAG